jgi:hypothetical protein
MDYKPTGPLFCLRALAALAQWTLLWINALNAFLICQILFIHKQEIYNGSGDRSGKPASTRCALRWVSTAHGFLVQRRRQQNSLRTSPDGLKWTPGSDTGQTSGAARPGRSIRGGLELNGTCSYVFVANDPSNDPTELAGLTEYNRVSKRIGSIYRRGRSPHWIKVKTPTRPPSRARLRRIGTAKNCRRRGGPMLNSMGVQHDRRSGRSPQQKRA